MQGLRRITSTEQASQVLGDLQPLLLKKHLYKMARGGLSCMELNIKQQKAYKNIKCLVEKHLSREMFGVIRNSTILRETILAGSNVRESKSIL